MHTLVNSEKLFGGSLLVFLLLGLAARLHLDDWRLELAVEGQWALPTAVEGGSAHLRGLMSDRFQFTYALGLIVRWHYFLSFENVTLVVLPALDSLISFRRWKACLLTAR